MVGQNIGKYPVLDRIGRGGMGTVYRAIDETLHREVAIKVLNAELNDPSVARRFRAEAVTVARLNHPGIATVYELFQHEGQWLMVMEFVRGETLEALVSRKGPLADGEAVNLCMDALAALAHAHSLGVVHRDLKPANIMFTESGVVKVMDFGIARVVGTEHLTSAGFMMGTPAYMAPEQVLGEDIDARADIYAMGVVLYHLVTGQLPFRGNTPFEMAQSRLRDEPTPVRTIRADLPEWLGTILKMALSRDPAQRFQSAAMFREALRRGLANLPLETEAAAVVPPELVATAAPSSMPVASRTPTPIGTSSASPASLPVQAAIPHAPAATRAPAATVQTAVPAAVSAPPRTWTKVALLAGVVIVAGLLTWTTFRQPAPAPEAPADTAPSVALATDTAAPPAPDPAPAPPAAPSPSPGAAGSASGAAAPPTAATSAAAAGASPAPASAASGTTAAGTSTTAAGETSTTAARRGGPPARGRGSVDDAPLDFTDCRLLVVAGDRAEEQPGVLNFGGGRVAVVSEQGGKTLGSMPYGEITYALYTHAREPKWSPVLAAPPANVDLPGNLFTPSRHWLALQSRATFLIVRLSDANWRQVLQTVTSRTGLEVQLSGTSD